MSNQIKHFGFQPKNYRILLIGIALNLIGFLLMIGGGSDDPNKFDGDALFSTVRITIAPMFIVAGYGAILFSIVKKPKKINITENELNPVKEEPQNEKEIVIKKAKK